jgi:hypothetical protein
MIKAGRQSHVLLSSYPALSSYLEYIMLIEKAHIETIGAEVSRLEQEEYAARVINAGEARLVKRSRENYLNIQLANFSLTREEWNEYKASGMHGRDSRRAPFEDFYRLAERRDQTLSKNLLKQMSNHNTVVAVVGGFHASRVQGALQKEGIQLYRTQVGDRYVTELMREKNLILGGENSGHYLFLDQNTTGDGLFSALEVLALLHKKKWKASALKKTFSLFPQKLLKTLQGYAEQLQPEEFVLEGELESPVGLQFRPLKIL